jgi:hypothetical protein
MEHNLLKYPILMEVIALGVNSNFHLQSLHVEYHRAQFLDPLLFWVSPLLQATKALRESRGIALLCFQTSALERGEGSASRPDRWLPPGKTRHPLYSRLGGPQGQSGQVQKISPPPGFNPRTVQLVASRYTDWATEPTPFVFGAYKLPTNEYPERKIGYLCRWYKYIGRW